MRQLMTHKRHKRVTIRDIASAAGVSPATVSRILNNTAAVDPDKEKLVLQAIEQLKFQPNTAAQGLARGRSSTIGVLTQHLGSPFFGEMLLGIESGLRTSRYVPIFASSQWNMAKDLAVLDTLMRRQVDALIVIGGELPADQLLELAERLPIVVVARQIEGLEDQCVCLNNFDGAYRATNYLIEMGHTSIAHITGNLTHQDAHDRRAGYLQALQDAKLNVNPHFIVAGDYTEASGVIGVARLLTAGDGVPFSAIFAANDQIAAGARLALHRRGIRVPEDISLVGFDDVPSSAYMTPPLTTVRQPALEMGEKAAQLILAMLENKSIQGMLFPIQLVIRESVAIRK
jgi:LacI family transcriptional regulator